MKEASDTGGQNYSEEVGLARDTLVNTQIYIYIIIWDSSRENVVSFLYIKSFTFESL